MSEKCGSDKCWRCNTPIADTRSGTKLIDGDISDLLRQVFRNAKEVARKETIEELKKISMSQPGPWSKQDYVAGWNGAMMEYVAAVDSLKDKK